MDAYIRGAVAVVGVVLAVVGTGCAGVAGEPAADTGPRGHPARLDEDRLRLALLDLNDLPSGWAADSERAAKKRGIGVPQPADGPCRTVLRDATGTADSRAASQFARTRVGPFVVTRAGSYGSGRAARGALAAFERAGKKCGEFEIVEGPEGEGEPVVYEAQELEMPRIGDGSVALRFTREGPGPERITVIADVVYARVGASTVHLAQAGRADLGAEDVEPMVRRAVHKLREVAADRTPRPTGTFPDVTELSGRADAPYARSHE